MRRRDLTFALAAGVGLAALPAHVREAFAQAELSDDDYEASALELLLGELGEAGGQRIDAVGRSEIAATDRSSIQINGTDAGLQAPQLTPELRQALAARNYWRLAPEQRPAPRWAPMSRAPDYQHLQGISLSSPRFELNAAILRVLAERNSFQLNDRRPVLIFGLRGCKISGGADASPWAMTHQLEAWEPTHLDCRCVIGVLRKSDGMIALFRGSTVPAVASIYKALGAPGWGPGLLPTGLYTYRAGSVSAGVPAQRGALLITGRYCVLRTTNDLEFDPFSAADVWSSGFANHIHCGGDVLRPDSAGGQAVPGAYRGVSAWTATGLWAEFRRAAGLVDDDGMPIAADETPSFQYMLLTGREAALAYQGGAAFNNGYLRLRPGSSGADVRALQQRLFSAYTGIVGSRIDGEFGMLTSFAVLLDKKETEGEFTSPIVSI